MKYINIKKFLIYHHLCGNLNLSPYLQIKVLEYSKPNNKVTHMGYNIYYDEDYFVVMKNNVRYILTQYYTLHIYNILKNNIFLKKLNITINYTDKIDKNVYKLYAFYDSISEKEFYLTSNTNEENIAMFYEH